VLKYASDLTCSSIQNYTVDGEVMVYMALNDMEALYENSKPFSNFLKKQGLEALLKKTNLRLREKHRIFPHVRSSSRPLHLLQGLHIEIYSIFTIHSAY